MNQNQKYFDKPDKNLIFGRNVDKSHDYKNLLELSELKRDYENKIHQLQIDLNDARIKLLAATKDNEILNLRIQTKN